MKKFLCCALVLAACLCAFAEPHYDSVRLGFEDGFSLSLPAEWVSYAVPPELADDGYLYCLGSPDGERLMYIQRWATDFTGMDELEAMLLANESVILRSVSENADGCPFAMYNFADSDFSGCMTIWNESILNLLFTPQSDPESMLIAATVMETIEFPG